MVEKKISIIVPFKTMNEYVLECIKGCCAQTHKSFELILLPDEKIKLASNIKDKRIRIVVTGNKNISQKRNIGIKESKNAEFIACVDSDAYPENNWLSNAMNGFVNNSNIWAIGGPNITPPKEPLKQRVVGNASQSVLISGANAFRKNISYDRECKDLPTCNLIFRTNALRKLNGFNESLLTGEDVELCRRIVAKGAKIKYLHNVVVYHHNRSLFAQFFNQRLVYGHNAIKNLKTYFNMTHVLLFLLSLFILLLIASPIMLILKYELGIKICFSIIALYFFIIIVEALRFSRTIKEFFPTIIALIIGNLSPAVGAWAALIGLSLDIRKMYSNAPKK